MADVKQSLDNAFQRYLNRSRTKTAALRNFSANVEESLVAKAAAPVAIPRQFEIQKALRPLFGKGPPQEAVIGDHPDFQHLAETDSTENHYIVTLFMDIEASTRLSLLVNLETVFAIKNSIICAAIEIVQSFDGHVHRIMGDAIMAFFGGKSTKPEQAVIDGLNAASILRYFAEKSVIPNIKGTCDIETLGIRIGLDYGKESEVLWSSYGYPGTSEVTATSYYVDVAAKLQHSAGRNEIMLGDSLKSFVDFPSEFLETKKIDGRDDLFVTPNHTDREGKPRNYRKFGLHWDSYLKCTALAASVKDLPYSNEYRKPDSVQIEIFHISPDGTSPPVPYFPGAAPIPKGQEILFRVRLGYQPKLPFTLKFVVENHGNQAEKATKPDGPKNQNHETVVEETKYGTIEFEHGLETALYRGLHFMTVSLTDPAGLQWKHLLGIYVE